MRKLKTMDGNTAAAIAAIVIVIDQASKFTVRNALEIRETWTSLDRKSVV